MNTRKLASMAALLMALLVSVVASAVIAAPASVAVRSFSDDAQAQTSALNNDDFSSTAPAGPRVTMAVVQALSAAGITVVTDGSAAAAVLSGRVTAAWVNSGMLPTNSVSAHYTLTDSASGDVLMEGNASGAAFNDADAAAELGKKIAAKVGR